MASPNGKPGPDPVKDQSANPSPETMALVKQKIDQLTIQSAFANPRTGRAYFRELTKVAPQPDALANYTGDQVKKAKQLQLDMDRDLELFAPESPHVDFLAPLTGESAAPLIPIPEDFDPLEINLIQVMEPGNNLQFDPKYTPYNSAIEPYADFFPVDKRHPDDPFTPFTIGERQLFVLPDGQYPCAPPLHWDNTLMEPVYKELEAFEGMEYFAMDHSRIWARQKLGSVGDEPPTKENMELALCRVKQMMHAWVWLAFQLHRLCVKFHRVQTILMPRLDATPRLLSPAHAWAIAAWEYNRQVRRRYIVDKDLGRKLIRNIHLTCKDPAGGEQTSWRDWAEPLRNAWRQIVYKYIPGKAQEIRAKLGPQKLDWSIEKRFPTHNIHLYMMLRGTHAAPPEPTLPDNTEATIEVIKDEKKAEANSALPASEEPPSSSSKVDTPNPM